MGIFATKKPTQFLAAKYRVVFVQLKKYRVDFCTLKIRVDFCTTLKVSGRFLYNFKNIELIFDRKISGRFFVQVAKYRVDF